MKEKKNQKQLAKCFKDLLSPEAFWNLNMQDKGTKTEASHQRSSDSCLSWEQRCSQILYCCKLWAVTCAAKQNDGPEVHSFLSYSWFSHHGIHSSHIDGHDPLLSAADQTTEISENLDGSGVKSTSLLFWI